MQADAEAYTRKCEQCQLFSPLIHQPAKLLAPITSPWPFAQWGLDIVGPMPKAPAGKKFLVVATDYFTKWIEAEALVKITQEDMRKFVWKSIITRFGIPRALISDNGSQFIGGKFTTMCDEYGIEFFNSTPVYPQGNGQAEASNKTLLDGIKKRLADKKGKWVDELPTVLWAYRTTPRRPTGETPFSLAYGLEAIIPLEVGLPTIRTEIFQEAQNDEALRLNLDFIEERREAALIRLAAYQRQLAKDYNKRVKPREFTVGDWVLRRVVKHTAVASHGKLGANWEGPYRVTRIAGHGAYYLETRDGQAIPNPWNTLNLRAYLH
jgi:hypothetical protein